MSTIEHISKLGKLFAHLLNVKNISHIGVTNGVSYILQHQKEYL